MWECEVAQEGREQGLQKSEVLGWGAERWVSTKGAWVHCPHLGVCTPQEAEAQGVKEKWGSEDLSAPSPPDPDST